MGRTNALTETIATRPPWLAERLAWITRTEARRLAARPGMTIDAVAWAIAETRRRSGTLKNPAGFTVATLRNLDAATLRMHADQAERRAEQKRRAAAHLEARRLDAEREALQRCGMGQARTQIGAP